MEDRVALIGIIVSDYSATESINNILHDYRQYVVGRMGIPYEKRKVAVVSVVIDAPNDIINSLSGKLGNIEGVNIKTVYSQIEG